MSDGSRRRGVAFNYQAPTYETAVQLSERRGRSWDAIFADGIKFFKARNGDNQIRILPPSWEGHKHYSFEIKVHREVGPDKQQYLCLNQERAPDRGRCPICAERAELVHTVRTQADKEEVDKMRPSTSGVIFLIDRFRQRETDAGPVIWQISTRTDNEILSQSLIKSSQMYLPIAHPVEGYDVEFNRSGEGLMTRYNGFRVARSSSPVSNDPEQLQRWMDYLDDHPIPEILNFYPESHIRAVWGGQSARRPDPEDGEERRVPAEPAARTREVTQDDMPPPRDTPPWEGEDRVRGNGGRTAAEAAPAARPRAVVDEPPRTSPRGGGVMDRLRQKLNDPGG